MGVDEGNLLLIVLGVDCYWYCTADIKYDVKKKINRAKHQLHITPSRGLS